MHLYFLDTTGGVRAPRVGGGLAGNEGVMADDDDRLDVHDRRLDTGILLLTLTIIFGLYIRWVIFDFHTTHRLSFRLFIL